jgi:hypothetical protein
MRARAVAVAGVSVALLTACSGTVEGVATASGSPTYSSPAKPSGPDLASQAADALEQAGAVHVVTQVATNFGEPLATMDFSVQGGDLAGTVTEGGSTVQLVLASRAAYLQAPAAWWTAQGAPESVAARLDNAWVHVSDDFAAGFTPFTVPALVDSIRHPSSGSYYPGVHADRLDDQPIWQVRPTDDGVWVAVAADGTPYPLDVSWSASVDGQYEFIDVALTEFGVAQPIVPPTDYLDFGG